MTKPALSYTLSSRAYTKLVLHCTKYAAFAVNGLVIGRIRHGKKEIENVPEDSASASAKHVVIEDTIPLFHGTGMYLEPMTLVALQQVQEYCSQTNQLILGCYVANEGYADTSIPGAVAKLATRIHENLASSGVGAILMAVDNSKLAPQDAKVAIRPYTYQTSQWKPLPTSSAEWNTASTFSEDLPTFIQTPAIYNMITDFDNHLDNVSLDWIRNSKLEDAITAQGM
ncbi:hypothetical protein SeMB42_g00319 [Synchytrium endobioticum]|uniref:MPN domain-containing protein n=1 Tax=Synchytrium endobioticum TaxID=286115 RepID=A0A507DRM4_9FUNG|nr:hypothetical protein SeLEV6574_g01854 [Synchytrium endobioticum]TPX54363.1 hypothetical protein SeMB42_g00319 [Synchytrium endobioticum]